MIALLLKLIRGHVRQHGLETALCLLGITLGVAVVVGIDLAVGACVSSFHGAARTLAGRATHSIMHARGHLTDAETIALLQDPAIHFPLAPVLDRRVTVGVTSAGPGSPPAKLAHFLGVDPYAERSLRTQTAMEAKIDEGIVDRLISEPNQVIIVKTLADALGVKAGQTIILTFNTIPRPVKVLAVMALDPPADQQAADLILADLSTGQELLGGTALNEGVVDRIDTVLPTAADEESLRSRLPHDMELRSIDENAQSLEELTAAYRLNLMSLSLMASLVAVFIVYNAMLVSVQQRATSLGILRCLGASRLQLASIYLVEALTLAVLGSGLGLLCGWGISHVLVELISTTINDLYSAVRPGPVNLDATVACKGFAVALVSSLAGAIVPLWHASSTPPISSMRSSETAGHSSRAGARAAVIGAGLMLLTAMLPYFPSRSAVVGFAMAGTGAIGFALVCPFLAQLAASALNRIGRATQLLPLQMAAAGVYRSIRITGVAVAAMMLALAMTVGIQTMVASFRSALEAWLDHRYRFDVFVAPRLNIDYKANVDLESEVFQWVKSQPESRMVVTYRNHETRVEGRSVQALATQVGVLIHENSVVLKSSSAGEFDPTQDVLASEPLAAKASLSPGQWVTLDTPTGARKFRVFGVYFDFGPDRGQVMLDSRLYVKTFADPSISSLHVRLADGVDADACIARWQTDIGSGHAVVVQSFRGLKAIVMTVFDRTFAVTRVLAWLAGGIAFCGLAGTLLALSLARAKDHAVLTSLGMSGGQVALWLVAEGLLIGVSAAVIASVAGTALAYILADVIQYRSFGWSIPTGPRPMIWMQTLAMAVSAAILASLYPLRTLFRSPPASALRRD